jgi:hypothetical protein
MLLDILQIRRPVRVNLIGTRPIPTSRCFGPLPRASSEGFLDSFTPGCIVIDCGYGLFSEDSSYVSHLFDERQPIRGRRRSQLSHYQVTQPDPVSAKDGSAVSLRGEETRQGIPGRDLRRDLMMIAPEVNWDPRTQLMRPFRKGRITKNESSAEVLLRTTQTTWNIKRFIKELLRKRKLVHREPVRLSPTNCFGKQRVQPVGTECPRDYNLYAI